MYVYKQLNSGNIHLNHHQEPKNMIYPPKKIQKKKYLELINFICRVTSIQVFIIDRVIITVKCMKTYTVSSFESEVFFIPGLG